MTANIQFYKSQVNPALEFSDSIWLVSLLNTGKKITGHGRIIVEGRKHGQSFVGRYELFSDDPLKKYSDISGIARLNIPGYICEIGVREDYNYQRDYTSYHSKSWFAQPQDVKKMISTIKTMKNRVDAEWDKFEQTEDISHLTHKYQSAGAYRWNFLGNYGGHNCVTWAEEMLAIANVGNGIKTLDSIKAAPEAHVIEAPHWSSVVLGLLGTSISGVYLFGKVRC